MNCLVIAATAKEIEPFLAHCRETDSGTDTDVLITGVGLTATAYTLTRQVILKRPNLILQAGIAGCYDPAIELGEVLAVNEEAIADQAVREGDEWKTVFDIGLMHPDQPPFKKGVLPNPHREWLKKCRLKTVTAVSVNQVTTLPSFIAQYVAKFAPTLESMEGAALHYVARREKIPFLQIRAVSNYIGERDKGQWKIREAIRNLNNELIRLTRLAGTKKTKPS